MYPLFPPLGVPFPHLCLKMTFQVVALGCGVCIGLGISVVPLCNLGYCTAGGAPPGGVLLLPTCPVGAAGVDAGAIPPWLLAK